MQRERLIIHLNVADFAVAVERVVDRMLCGRPVIIAPPQAARATVYDMSDEAYDDGVRKGMPLQQALRRCRAARVLPPAPDRYRRAMAALVAEAGSYSPLLEHGLEDGHLFLDLTGTHRLFGSAPDIGWRLRKQLRSKLGIDPIWSLAGNKLVAKVASRLVKPAGEYIVGNGEEAAFLAPVPVLLLPGLADQEVRRLQACNITRVGQLAALDTARLQAAFGSRGEWLYRASRGIDDEAVRPVAARPPSLTVEQLFADDIGDRRLVEGVIGTLAVRLGMGLRATRLAARRLILHLLYTDGSRAVRQLSVKQGIADDYALRRLALSVLERAWTRRLRLRGCRLIGDCLHRQSPQLRLFVEPSGAGDRAARLTEALDTVRQRFGSAAVRFGNEPIRC